MLADGNRHVQEVELVTAPVKIQSRTINTTFLVLPGTLNAKTLLGIGFIEDARVAIDFKIEKWHLSGFRHRTFEFIQSDELDFEESATIAMVDEVLKQCTIPEAMTPLNTPKISMWSDIHSDFTGNYVLDAPMLDSITYIHKDAEAAIGESWDKEVCLFQIDINPVREAQHLTKKQRFRLNNIIKKYEDLFADNGPPILYA